MSTSARSTDLGDETWGDAPYRPRLLQEGVEGSRCSTCAYAVAPGTPRCPACGGSSVPTLFSAVGTVWASTIVHIPVGDRLPPFGLAYIDLDEGPRVLVGAPNGSALPVGRRVMLELSGLDIVAVELEEVLL